VIDVVSIASAVGGSGLLIVGRDIWLARRTVRSSESAEHRNQSREPLIVEQIALGNTAKVTEIFRAAIAELEDGKKRAVEEFRDTRNRLETQLSQVNQELERVRKDNEQKDRTIRDLYAKLGELHDKLENMKSG